MPNPDARSRRTGRKPDIGDMTSLRPQMIARSKSMQQAVREVEALARANSAVPDSPAVRPIATVHDAAITLGLDAEKTRTARRLIQQVADDTRDMLAVSKDARKAGIPRDLIPELMRRGFDLHQRAKLSKAAPAKPAAAAKPAAPVKSGGGSRALPIGTIREWGGKKYRKVAADNWVVAGESTSAAGTPKGAVKTGRGVTTPERQQARGAAKAMTGSKAADLEHRGLPATGGLTTAKEVDPDVRARHRELSDRAKKVGLKVRGALHPNHTHEHLDQLEAMIMPHERAAKTREQGKGQVAPPSGGSGGGKSPVAPSATPDQPDAGAGGGAAHPTPPHPKSPEAQVPKDASGRPMGTTAPGASEPHEVARLRSGIAEAQQKLEAIQGHLDGPEMKAMYKRLIADGQKIGKKPSYQASEWHRQRVASFIALATGVVAGAAMGAGTGAGAGAGAMAGGVEGKAAKIEPGAPRSTQREAERATSGPKPKPKKKVKSADAPTLVKPAAVKKAGVGFYVPPPPDLITKAKPGEPPMEPHGSDHAGLEAHHGQMVGWHREHAQRFEALHGAIPSAQHRDTVLIPRLAAAHRRAEAAHAFKKARATKPVNEHGHRDGLIPGQVLKLRERHAHLGDVIVKADGRFELSGEDYDGAKALLTAIHGNDPNHHMTVRRYFGLGGEENVDEYGLRNELRGLLKSDAVLVQQVGGTFTLTGDLVKAGVPAFLLPHAGAHMAEIDRDAAVTLRDHLRGDDAEVHAA